jgi:hypothetical protein
VLRVAPTPSLGRNRLQKSPTCPTTISFGLSTTRTGNRRNGPTSSRSTRATTAATATTRPVPRNHRQHPETQQSPTNFKNMVGLVVELMMSSMRTAMMENITGRMEGREMITCLGRGAAASLFARPSTPFRSADARLTPGTSWLENSLASALGERHRLATQYPASLTFLLQAPCSCPVIVSEFIARKDGANETTNTGRCSLVGSTGRRQTVSPLPATHKASS